MLGSNFKSPDEQSILILLLIIPNQFLNHPFPSFNTKLKDEVSLKGRCRGCSSDWNLKDGNDISSDCVLLNQTPLPSSSVPSKPTSAPIFLTHDTSHDVLPPSSRLNVFALGILLKPVLVRSCTFRCRPRLRLSPRGFCLRLVSHAKLGRHRPDVCCARCR